MHEEMRVAFAIVCMILASGCEQKTARAEASASTTGGEIELAPKKSFGPIRLGATKADVEALGILKTHPQYSAMTIPYTVYYDPAGAAERVQLSLKYAPANVKIGSVVIPRTATFDEAKALLGDCKDNPPAHGGITSNCRGGDVHVSVGSGSPTEVWIEAIRPSPQTR